MLRAEVNVPSIESLMASPLSCVNRRPVKVSYMRPIFNVPMVEWSGWSAICRSTLVRIRLTAPDV